MEMSPRLHQALEMLQTSGPPEALRFPRQFNPHAVDLWFDACQKPPKDIRSAWIQALSRYWEACKSAGLSPFADQTAGDINQAIKNYLYKRRTLLVRYLNLTKLLQGLKDDRLRITRHAYVEGYGFSITIEGPFRIEDPTFKASLFGLKHGHRFSRIRSFGPKAYMRYQNVLEPGLVLIAEYNPRVPSMWNIGYTIRCPLHPVYDENHSKEGFILQELWGPLVAAYRPLRRPLNRQI